MYLDDWFTILNFLSVDILEGCSSWRTLFNPISRRGEEHFNATWGGQTLPGYRLWSQEGPGVIEMGQTHYRESSGDVLWSHEEIFNFKYQGAAQQPSQILVFYWPAQS